MEFIVRGNGRWDNGHYYCQMSFKEILETFLHDGNFESDLDDMIQGVANLDINQVFKYTFFMNDTYTFRRIK